MANCRHQVWPCWKIHLSKRIFPVMFDSQRQCNPWLARHEHIVTGSHYCNQVTIIIEPCLFAILNHGQPLFAMIHHRIRQGYPMFQVNLPPQPTPGPPCQADVNAGDSEGDSPLAHARALESDAGSF